MLSEGAATACIVGWIGQHHGCTAKGQRFVDGLVNVPVIREGLPRIDTNSSPSCVASRSALALSPSVMTRMRPVISGTSA